MTAACAKRRPSGYRDWHGYPVPHLRDFIIVTAGAALVVESLFAELFWPW